jgi:PKD repeat protein
MMKMKFASPAFILLSLALLTAGCTKKGFPVPPASTVPLFSYTVDNNGFAPATVTFTNESIVPEANGVPSYSWNFGDAGTSTLANPTHLYSAPGVYSATLVIKMTISDEIRELSKDIIIKNSAATGIPVFFTNGTLVYSGFLNSDAPVFSALPVGPFQGCYDLEIDTVNSKLYISDADAKKIYQCNLDGTGLIDFRTNLLGPDGLAIDYTGNKLYWDTDDGVQRADLSSTDVSQKEDFVTGQSAYDPEGVSIDPVNRKLYWTSYEDGGGVWRKNLDGTGQEQLTPLVLVSGGSTLVAANKLFFDFYNASGDIHVKSANLDGTSMGTISTNNSKVIFGIGYDPKGGKIYWGDRSAGKIMRANTDGSVVEAWYVKTGSSPRGIVFGKRK